MSDVLLTAALALVGVAVLSIATVVLALRVHGDRVVTWSGFGVSFRVAPAEGTRPAESSLGGE